MNRLPGSIRRGKLAPALLALTLFAVTACSGGKASDTNQDAQGCSTGLTLRSGQFCGIGLDPAQPRPSFQLRDASGRPYSFQQATNGVPTLLYFGYTKCPDACPATVAFIAQALHSLPAKDRGRVKVVFVTTDPAEDTGPQMTGWIKQIAQTESPQFTELTGTLADIKTAEAAAKVSLSNDDGKLHSTEVLFYGPDDYARVAFALSNNEAADMTHDIPLILRP